MPRRIRAGGNEAPGGDTADVHSGHGSGRARRRHFPNGWVSRARGVLAARWGPWRRLGKGGEGQCGLLVIHRAHGSALQGSSTPNVDDACHCPHELLHATCARTNTKGRSNGYVSAAMRLS